MPSISVYGGRFGSSFRVHWMLTELGLPYETKTLDMRAGEHKQPPYLAINPAGQVPAMVYDGFTITESAAIIHYLADKHRPALLGATPEDRATALRWSLFTLLNIDKHFATLAGKSWGMPAAPEADAAAREALSRFLAVIEGRLGEASYLAGSEFSIADVIARSSFNYAEAAEFDLSGYPRINAWITRCTERPSYGAAKQG